MLESYFRVILSCVAVVIALVSVPGLNINIWVVQLPLLSL